MSIPLPPDDLESNLDISAVVVQLALHDVNVPHLLGQIQQNTRRHLNTALVNMTSENSQSGSTQGLNRNLLHILCHRN